MDLKPKKQLWLETLLKKLCQKVNSSIQTGEKVEKPKPVGKVIHRKGFPKRKADSDTQRVPFSKKQKRCYKENSSEDKSSNEDFVREYSEDFWNFVDDFLHSRPFHPKTKKGYLSIQPSSINYCLWKNIGRSSDFQPRVVRLSSQKFSHCAQRKILRHQLTSLDEEKALAVKVFYKVQRARMKESADKISNEFKEEEDET